MRAWEKQLPLVTVLPPTRNIESRFQSKFCLVRDNWNDYGYETSYVLYAKEKEGAVRVGTVKIMHFENDLNSDQTVTDDFDKLGKKFISIGDSLDYYERLNELPEEDRELILEALLDAVRYQDRIPEFRTKPAWSVSLFRGGSSEGLPRERQDAFIRDAEAILTGNFTKLADLDTQFSFRPHGWNNALEVSYDAPKFSRPTPMLSSGTGVRPRIPHRIAVLIGRNGAGKSTLLANLARVAHASPKDRTQRGIKSLGVLKPEGLGFTRLIAVSYSAFDSFSLPGTTIGELKQIAEDVERGEGRYIFCGLRDVVSEVREDLERLQAEKDVANNEMRVRIVDRRPSTQLKSLETLSDEFVRLLEKISGSEKRLENFDASLAPILAELSFEVNEEEGIQGLLGDDPKKSFLLLSTGHKIILHVIASIVAHAAPRSLILFDEPETHLHPPLTAALMTAVRVALERNDAFAVIATHSPIVLQETLSRHVRIIERAAGETVLRQPSGETFGENVGTLVYDTFGVTSGTTDFHDVLDQLIKLHETVDEIDDYFSPGLSAQARAYVMSRHLKKEIEP